MAVAGNGGGRNGGRNSGRNGGRNSNSGRFNGAKRVIKGINAVRKSPTGKKAKGFAKGLAKDALKFSLTSAGALLGATAATVTTIGSGNIGDGAKNIASGAFAGGALASKGTDFGFGVVDHAKNISDSIRDTADTFQSGYDPVGYKEKMDEREAEQAYKDITGDGLIMGSIMKDHEDMSEDEIDDAIKEYTRQGITDYNDINKGLELEEKANVDRETAIKAAKISKLYTNEYLRKNENDVIPELADALNGNVENPNYKAIEAFELTKMFHGATVRDAREAVRINEERRSRNSENSSERSSRGNSENGSRRSSRRNSGNGSRRNSRRNSENNSERSTRGNSGNNSESGSRSRHRGPGPGRQNNGNN